MNNILDCLKIIAMTIAAIFAGIFSWWVMLCLAIILAGIIAFVCVPLAWVIFGVALAFVVLSIIVQMFNI